jgi:hypothetical protein
MASPMTSPIAHMASTPTTTTTTSSPPTQAPTELSTELFSELLPRYTTLWPGQDACETCTRTRRRYLCARCTGRSPPVRSWHSLELVLLAQMHASLWPAVHARTQELVRPDRFHCYRELHGGPGAFYPRILPQRLWPLRNYSELLMATPRVHAFRLRVWATCGRALVSQAASRFRAYFPAQSMAQARHQLLKRRQRGRMPAAATRAPSPSRG